MLRSIIGWFRALASGCVFTDHENFLVFETGRVFLECQSCGHISPGWDVTSPTKVTVDRRVRVGVYGDSAVFNQWQRQGTSCKNCAPAYNCYCIPANTFRKGKTVRMTVTGRILQEEAAARVWERLHPGKPAHFETNGDVAEAEKRVARHFGIPALWLFVVGALLLAHSASAQTRQEQAAEVLRVLQSPSNVTATPRCIDCDGPWVFFIPWSGDTVRSDESVMRFADRYSMYRGFNHRLYYGAHVGAARTFVPVRRRGYQTGYGRGLVVSRPNGIVSVR